MYQAVIAKISTAPHPNADRLQIGYVCGSRVIVGLDTKDGEVGVFFLSDGQLSNEYANANDLVIRKDENNVKIGGGYFDEKRRVRAQNFRGVKSEGLYMPLKSLEFTGYDLSKLKVGDMFDELNKIPICNKYYTKATLNAIKNGKRTSKKWLVDMPEHYDTAQFRFVHIPEGSVIHISEKEHGTSVRYGNVLVKRDKSLLGKLWAKLTGGSTVSERYEYVLGTRRALLPKTNEYEFGGGYYGNGDPYTLAPSKLYGKLKEGEIIYGEVVGYLKTGAPLFTQNTKHLKDIKSAYGEDMVFSYGCVEGNARLRVYRITQNGRDLSWFEIQNRCEELGVETVHHIETLVFDGDRNALNAKVEALLEGQSFLDHRHIREGVCLRVENKDTLRSCKAKSWTFGVLEGYIKSDDNYVDLEEIA